MRSKSSYSAISLLAMAAASATPTALLAQTVQSLPGLVIEGATLDKPRRPEPQAQPEQIEAAQPKPQPTQPQASKAVDPKQASQNAPATAPTPAPVSSPAPAEVQTPGGQTPGISVDRIGSSVSVVTAADIQRQQVRTTAEALRSLPGVEVNVTGSTGNLTQVRIRGADSKQTLVLIDGIEANSVTDGDFDFSDLSPEQIERVEVIRGPQSGLYGSNASGGVINIITRGGQGPITAYVRGEVGTYKTRDTAAGVSGGTAALNAAASVHVRDTAGFNLSPPGQVDNSFAPDKEGSRLASFAFKGHAALAPNVALDVSARMTDKLADRDGNSLPYPTAPYLTATDDPSHLHDLVSLLGAQLRFDSFGGALTQTIKANQNHTVKKDFDYSNIPSGGAVSTTSNDSRTVKLGYQATYRFVAPVLPEVKNALSALVEKQYDEFTPFSDAGYTDNLKRKRTSLGLVAEYRGEIADQLFLTQSVRRDLNDTFADFTTWRTTGAWKIPGTGLRPHASIGTGVKVPGMYELFGAALFNNGVRFIPNPNLVPETTLGYDAGVDFAISKNASVDVTYFNTTLKDRISGSGKTLINTVGESKRSGVEAALKIIPMQDVQLGLAYTYLDARNPDGTREVRRPEHTARGDVTWGFDAGRGKVSLAAVYNGTMLDSAFDANFVSSNVSLDPYWLVTVASSYELKPGVEVFGRVENALNAQYQEVYGYQTAGIAAYAGMKFTFVDPSTKAWAEK